MTGVPEIDVVVAGGGPAGLATAIGCARAGLSVVVAEPRPAPIDKACGEGLMPGALPRLAALGITAGDLAGQPIRGIRYLDAGHSADAPFRRGDGLGVRRTELHAALTARALALGVKAVPDRVVAHDQDEAGVTVATRQERLRARYLVAADGLHSPVRRSLGLDPPPARHVRYGLRRHYRLAPWTDRVEVHFADGGEAYVTPVAPDMIGVAVLGGRRGSIRPARGARAALGDGSRAGAAGSAFDERLAAFPALRERLAGAPGASEARGAGPLRQDVRRRVAGRVLLVGDAAGYLDALTGEGIGAALAQADVLAACLAAGRPGDYERACRRVTRAGAAMTGALLWSRGQPLLGARIVPAAQRLPWLFGAIVNQVAWALSSWKLSSYRFAVARPKLRVMTLEEPGPVAAPRATAPAVPLPDLLVRTEAGTHQLRPGSSYRVGRDPQGHVVLADPRVSWAHGEIRSDGGSWTYTDNASRNGSFLGPDRVNRVEVGDARMLRLGHRDDGSLLGLVPLAARQPSAEPLTVRTPVQQATAADAAGATTALAPPAPSPQPAPLRDAPTMRADMQALLAEGVIPASLLPGSDLAPFAGLAPGDLAPLGAPAPAGRAAGAGAHPTSVIQLPATTLRIGRAAGNDIVLDDLIVSRHHAELRPAGGGYELADLGSHNGTFCNGERLTAARAVTELDVIGIGHSTFRLGGGELRQFVDSGEVTVVAHDLVVQIKGGKADGKVLLDRVAFPIPEKCLLGVIGPSGAGKSTLLGALTGLRPATTGAVLYDNRDLYEHYAELRHRIGLVPQENILHTQLTARAALQYSAELRFPADTTAAERDQRVAEVMDELGLARHADTRADRLSGGQLKRVNVAQELLTRPSLLFLDEPTSGLDPGLDKSVMRQLRDLAHDGRTIIVVTHSVLNLGECDRLLIMAPGGRMAFYGPPGDALGYFGADDWADVFQGFDSDPGRDWPGEFAASPLFERYVSLRNARPVDQENERLPVAPPPQRRGWVRQTATLTRRYARVIYADRGYVLFMGLLPLVLGGLIRFVPAKEGLAGAPGTNLFASELLQIMVTCACLAGTACSIRELVKERPIYTRERAAGLSSGGYLFSKVLLLGFISVVQSLIIVLLGLAGRRMPPHGVVFRSAPLLEILIAIAVLALASMCLGLLVSALVSTSEKAMPFLVMLTMGQIILSGGVLPLAGMGGLEQLSWIAPARWGFAAGASTVNLNLLTPQTGSDTDPLWGPTSGDWARDVLLTAGIGALCLALTWVSLRRLGPRRRR
ncbi:MAG TPA: ATP-binding cassette domain-containing protein [Trebonia sp.]|jgi:ABC-type multidrug transport system ATPase subunit/flavin-dependent dehydrogenase|nr:ATP-binding cassette domain-containing protein [Trebonia sp.]